MAAPAVHLQSPTAHFRSHRGPYTTLTTCYTSAQRLVDDDSRRARNHLQHRRHSSSLFYYYCTYWPRLYHLPDPIDPTHQQIRSLRQPPPRWTDCAASLLGTGVLCRVGRSLTTQTEDRDMSPSEWCAHRLGWDAPLSVVLIACGGVGLGSVSRRAQVHASPALLACG